MKTLLTIALFLLTLRTTQAQTLAGLPVDSTTKKITYIGVVPVANATKEELYARAQEWVAKSFKDLTPVSNQVANLIVVKPQIRSSWGITTKIEDVVGFALTITVKDGRYRYELTNVVCEVPATAINGRINPAQTVSYEDIFTNRAGYDKRGQPQPFLLDRMTSVNSSLRQVIFSLQQAEKSTTKDW
ncbi:DUF4468 domain-containing protein [Hymenobacter sp. GOD-10R]|uniref:DUF4468 domain-containing protein n=1 Tax=Hymenobacter sp. GOD-10R TaxID=3093922 RepID=UPI002D7A0C67|nr:DUF4468 domain-containing protein [Hymenobacter sp. GOD-10R]WRQ29142.1 DUF4468 domain-containing protein [Hymenobacter sp. GOD-10R]